MKRITLALFAAAALPAFAGIHFNGDIEGGQFDPDGSIAFTNSQKLEIGRNYRLKKGAFLGANVSFDAGHFNFGAGGWRAQQKEQGAPNYTFVLNGVTINSSDILSNKLNTTQYDAWLSYEWDLAKYFPGVSFQTGPMLKVANTKVETDILNLSTATRYKHSVTDTAGAVGGRLHLGFIKDLLSVDAQAATSLSGDHRYRDLQARVAIHPMPFFYVGVGWRDNRAEARKGSFDATTGISSGDRFDIGQKGWMAFLGWRIGAGGR